MGKKEQLKSIISLLASQKIIIQEGGNNSINFTQKDFDELVPLALQKMKQDDPSIEYSYDEVSKKVSYTMKDSNNESQTISFEGTVTDVNSFMHFVTSFAWLSTTDTASREEIEAYISSFLVGAYAESLFSDGIFSELATANRELVLETLKETYPLCIKLIQTYLKLLQQITN